MNAHVATFRRLPAATCPPRPGLSRSSDVHHQNASRATCAATTELASVGRCFLARRGNTAVRGQVSVVAMRPRAPHCLVFSTPTTEASSVVGRARAVDAEASLCHESVEQHTTTGLPRCTTREFMDCCPGGGDRRANRMCSFVLRRLSPAHQLANVTPSLVMWATGVRGYRRLVRRAP